MTNTTRAVITVIGLVVGLIVGWTIIAISEARSEEIIKTVPEDAVLEYRIKGQLVQSMPLRPGTYRLSVEELSPMQRKFRPRREHK